MRNLHLGAAITHQLLATFHAIFSTSFVVLRAKRLLLTSRSIFKETAWKTDCISPSHQLLHLHVDTFLFEIATIPESQKDYTNDDKAHREARTKANSHWSLIRCQIHSNFRPHMLQGSCKPEQELGIAAGALPAWTH
jgi:hypothetical protein